MYYRHRLNLIHKLQVTAAMDGQPPTPRWLSTIPWMVSQDPMDGHPPSKISSITFQRMITHHLQGGHPPSTGWSPTIIGMVTPYMGWSSTIQRMITYHLQDAPKPISLRPGDNYHKWSPTFPRMVPQLPQNGHLPSKDGHPLSQGWSPTYLN